LDPTTVLMLTGVAFAAGFFDAIAGGGGLITLPALMLAGVSPLNAIATNKVQAAAGSVSATVAFAKKGLIRWKEGRRLICLSAAGGVLGALSVSMINPYWLKAVVPVLLVLVALYFACAPALNNVPRPQRMSMAMLSFTVAPLIGFYDGFFGPGTGSFFLVCFVALCGLGIMNAMGFTKLANASSNLGSLAVFSMSGLIMWPLALTMAVAAFRGAQLGARAAVRVGPALIKPMIILVCLSLACKLFLDENNPIRLFLLATV
jgi:uncharacterized protein